MLIEELRQFLVDSNRAGYARGDSKKWIKESDGSETIPFEKDPWKSNDNFFGGEPYGGRTIVSHKGNPFWIMVYYGWVDEDAETDPVYAILRDALMRMPENHPYRGPKEYSENGLVYENVWNGDLDRFSGEEKITQNGKLLYKANYLGGLVDQRKGL
ncbi:MAG: DUF5680 domain-containing protein [Candidatus Wolfebacteria bacterium]|nr:DUF5680 domain-containing protein [Candidatus Wolfebacteria bacterium]